MGTEARHSTDGCPHPPGKASSCSGVAKNFLYTGWTSGETRELRRVKVSWTQSHQGTSRNIWPSAACGSCLLHRGGGWNDGEHRLLPQGRSSWCSVAPLTQAHDPGSPVLNLPWLHFLCIVLGSRTGLMGVLQSSLGEGGGSQHSGNPYRLSQRCQVSGKGATE